MQAHSALGGRIRIGAYLAVLVAFIAIAYVPSFSVPFAFDDLTNLVFNPAVQPDGWADLGSALHARGGQDRPVAMLSFALNYLFGGMDTTGYHAVNLIIHAANALLLFALLCALTRAPRSPERLRPNATAFAFACALLWALHPVNTQAVTYIVQRMTSLAALFYLLALLLFVLWRLDALRARWALPGLVLAFAAGMGTKSHVITLPAALLLLDIAFFAGWRRYHTVIIALLAASAIPVGLLAGVGLHSLLEAPVHRDFNGLERWLTQGRVIWHYLSLLVWPEAGRLQVDYDFTVSRALLDPPITAVTWTGLIALTAVSLYWLRRSPWLAGGWLFFMLALSVESSFILLELAFEHRLYLPATLLIAGLIAPVFSRLHSERAVAAAGLGVLLLAGVLALQTIERNREWGQLSALWAGDLERGASPQRAALNAAVAHLRGGDAQAAMEILDRAGIDADSGDAAKVHQVRGEALFAQDRCEEALDSFRAALRRVPGWARAAHFSVRCLLNLGREETAADVLAQMQHISPDSLFTVTLAADMAARDGDMEAGLAVLDDYLARRSELPAVDRAFVQMHRGNLYRRGGRLEAAAGAYRRATELNPNNWAAWSSLYHALREAGATERAARVGRYLHSRGVDPGRWR